MTLAYLPTLHVPEGETCPRCRLPGPHGHPEVNTHLRPGAPAVSITMAPGQMRHLYRLVRAHRKKVTRSAMAKDIYVPDSGYLNANTVTIELDAALEAQLVNALRQSGFAVDD